MTNINKLILSISLLILSIAVFYISYRVWRPRYEYHHSSSREDNKSLVRINKANDKAEILHGDKWINIIDFNSSESIIEPDILNKIKGDFIIDHTLKNSTLLLYNGTDEIIKSITIETFGNQSDPKSQSSNSSNPLLESVKNVLHSYKIQKESNFLEHNNSTIIKKKIIIYPYDKSSVVLPFYDESLFWRVKSVDIE